MKKAILFVVLLIFFGTIKAQSSAAEAKAAYLLAEEAFNANDWKEALKYLEQCKAKIGTVNSKILYLQIMTEIELAKTDAAYYDTVAKTIAAFEKAPDAGSFNEEKTLEVMKIKVRLKELLEVAKAKETLALEKAAAVRFADTMCTRLGLSGWQVGVKIEDMKKAHPDYFSKATPILGDTVEYYLLNSEQFFTVHAKRGIVVYISKFPYTNHKEDSSFTNGYAFFNQLKNNLGGSPEEKLSVQASTATSAKSGGFKTTTRTLTWKNRNVRVDLQLITNAIWVYKKPTVYESAVSFKVVQE